MKTYANQHGVPVISSPTFGKRPSWTRPPAGMAVAAVKLKVAKVLQDRYNFTTFAHGKTTA